MARLESIVKAGYFKFPTEHLEAVANMFVPSPSKGRILDPVAGTGEAVNFIGIQLDMDIYANELDSTRARTAQSILGPHRAIEGDMFRLTTSSKAYEMIWMNPPYTWDTNMGQKSSRREFDMMQWSFKWLAVGGYMVWIVYAQHVSERAASYLYQNCSTVDAYKIPGKHLDQYDQVIVVGKRGTNQHDFRKLGRELSYKVSQGDITSIYDAEYGKYEFEAAPEIKKFLFHTQQLTPDRLIEVVNLNNPKFSILENLRKPAEAPRNIEPIITPRVKQIAMFLLSGMFNGVVIRNDLGKLMVVRTKNYKMKRTTANPDNPNVLTETQSNATQVITINPNGEIATYTTDKEISEFIKTYKDVLMDYASKSFTAQYNFDYSEWANELNSVRMPVFNKDGTIKEYKHLYETQKHVIAGVSTGLKKQKAIMLSGEMGVGKTIMGAMVISLARKNAKHGQVAIVMCPSHLVEKWQREAKIANPKSVVMILENIKDADKLMASANDNPVMHLGILSMSTAKLGEGWKGAFNTKVEKVTVNARPSICPTCGQEIGKPLAKIPRGAKPRKFQAKVSEYFDDSKLDKKTYYCQSCHHALWSDVRSLKQKKTADGNTANARYPVALYIAKRYAGRIYMFLADEVHEMKSVSSGQGLAFSRLFNAADKAVFATGTLFGGVASSVYQFMYLANPWVRKEFPWVSMNKWAEEMGSMATTIVYREESNSTGMMTRVPQRMTPSEVPGIAPSLISLIIESAVFVSLTDIRKMDPIEEFVVPIDLDEKSQEEYDTGYDNLREYAVNLAIAGDRSAMAMYRINTLFYPDTSYRTRKAIHHLPSLDAQYVVHEFGKTDQELLNKEEWLVGLVADELSQGRGVAVFVEQTGQENLESRLSSILTERVPDANPFILKSTTVTSREREELLKKQVAAGKNVLICNAKLVQTGLDLLNFPTIIFMEISYSLYTMAQAARRSRRLNQENRCKVYYSVYKDTMQHKALTRVGGKSAASSLLSGESVSELGNNANDKYMTEFVNAVTDGEEDQSVFLENISDSDESLWSPTGEADSIDSKIVEIPEPVVPEIEVISEPESVEIPVISGPIIPIEVPPQRLTLRQQLANQIKQLSLWD